MSNDTPVHWAKPATDNSDLIKLSTEDNVAIALRDIAAGEQTETVTTIDEIPKGHKVALKQISKGTAVKKYAQIIGCLLYTSPSPRDGLLSRMPSSA